MYCVECGESLNEGAKFCFKCGCKQPEKEIVVEDIIKPRCTSCDTDLQTGWILCPSCGTKIKDASSAPFPRKKETLIKELHILAGEEKKYYGNEITISSNITCEGSLVFDHCILIYDGDDITNKIILEGDGSITFTYCTIIGDNYNIPSGYSDAYLIEGDGKGVFINNSVFYDCRYFIKAFVHIEIKNCEFLFDGYTCNLFAITSPLNITNKSKMQNCTVENIGNTPDEEPSGCVFEGIMIISSCAFQNIQRCIHGKWYPFQKNELDISTSIFVNCQKSILPDSNLPINITYCRFEECEYIVGSSLAGKLTLKNTQFIECKNQIFDSFTEAEVDKCQVYNHTAVNAYVFQFVNMGDTGSKIISNCLFDGMHFESIFSLVDCTNFGGTPYIVTLKKCTFKHCSSRNEIIKTTDIQGVQISKMYDCTGIDTVNKQGSKAIDTVILWETPAGEKIGADVDGLIAGVPGIDPGDYQIFNEEEDTSVH